MKTAVAVVAVVCVAVLFPVGVNSAASKDLPIVSSAAPTYLDGQWQMSSAAGTFPASVPGDILSDLHDNKLIQEPLHGLNWRDNHMWTNYTWSYSTSFTLDAPTVAAFQSGAQEMVLVFEGIKMGASISVNGKMIGTAVDQFLRYEFPLAESGVALNAGANTVTVKFDHTINVAGRFMACTGGWDWAPYTTTVQDSVGGEAHTFTYGIWRHVYILPVATTAFTAIVPQIFYTGDFPTSRLQPHQHAPFKVDVRTHFYSPAATTGTLTLTSSWSSTTKASASVSLPAGDSNQTLTITADPADIELWWPNGVGAQPLYNVSVSFTPDSDAGAAFSDSRRVGFRQFSIVTGNDTDPAYVKANANTDGTDTFGMRFKVNGVTIFARGANMIPMDEQEARLDVDAHRRLVQSGADAGFNLLRVWGGGVYQLKEWYDACDELGIIIYHDMQFAQQGHSPTMDSETQAKEFRYQVRRLSHHPALAIYDGCNECVVKLNSPTAVYVQVVEIVASEDMSRVLWPSCPAMGWTGGANRLTALPNGKPFIPYGSTEEVDASDNKIEVHGPYQHGSGFPSVNGPNTLVPFSPMTPPVVYPSTPVNQGQPNVFASEFGASVMSSFESMSPFLEKEHWGLHGGSPPDTCSTGFAATCTGGNVMAQRNYACDNYLTVFFNASEAYRNSTGETAFKGQLWMCMIAQAMNVKSVIEEHRSQNCYGLQTWQFGEIWPTGGWGSIEYATPNVAGQVAGGRWKPLHYWYLSSAFTDVSLVCGTKTGSDQHCFVKNDRAGLPLKGSAVVKVLDITTDKVTVVYNEPVTLPDGPGVLNWFSTPHTMDGSKEIMLLQVIDDDGTVLTSNFELFAPPYELDVPTATVTVTSSSTVNPDGSVDVIVKTDHAAVFVTLTTLAAGRFSDNAFIMTPGTRTLKFIPFGDADVKSLSSSLRVEHLGSYLPAAQM